MMKDAKAQYSEEKKAYDSRNQAEDAVANVAQVPQKEVTKSRVPKPVSSRATPGTSVPPSRSKAEGSPSTYSSDEESDGEHPEITIKKQDSDSSDEEISSPEPKGRRTGSVQPKTKKQK